MNKRQLKKFNKKKMCKTYYGYRYKNILELADKYNTNTELIYVVDSRRMDFKHIQSIKLLTNICPVQVPSLSEDLDIEFESNTVNNIKDSDVADIMKQWHDFIEAHDKSLKKGN